MPNFDFKTATPDTNISGTEYWFGADSQSAATPSIYSVGGLKTYLLGGGSLAITAGKTLTASNSLTLTGTDGTTMTFPSVSATLAALGIANLFTTAQTITPLTDVVGLTISGGPAGTTNILQVLDSSNNVLAAFDKDGKLTLGRGLALTGQLKFANSTNANVLTLQAGATSGSLTFTLPTSDGTSGQVLQTNGSGVLSWKTDATNSPGGSDTQVQYNNSGSFGGSAALTFGSNTLTIGTASTTTGLLALGNSASANLTKIQAGNASSSVTYTLPTADGSNGQVLSTNGSGTLSWKTDATTSPAGSDTQLQFNNSGSFGADSTLTFNSTSKLLTANRFSLAGNISSAAWTTNGIRYANVAATITDTSSSGTVANAYTDLFGGNTIAASNSTTYTNYYTMFVSPASAGSNVNFTNVYALGLGGSVNLTSGNLLFAGDTILGRNAAANLRLGAADAAAPVAQTLSVQSVVGGTNNTAGANLTITGSQGTGSGAGGSILFRVAPAGSSGSSQNALSTALTLAPSASGGGILTHAAGTLADGTNACAFTATMPSSPSGTSTGYSFIYTGAGSSSNGATAGQFSLAAGYTGSGGTAGFNAINSAAGTSTVYGSTNSYRPGGNRGGIYLTNASTSGTNVGLHCAALNSTNANYGIFSSATIAVNNAWNVGVLGFGLNTGTGTQQIGGYFALYDGGTNAPNLVSGALVCDNGSTSSPVFLARVNNSTAWSIGSTGHLTCGTDNTYDIGASGATRPRSLFIGTSIRTPQINNNAGTIGIEGTTSSFPALKRSSTTLQVRLADDSADAPINALSGTFTDNTANISAISSTGYSLTGSSSVSLVDLAGTWNTTGTPSAIKLNITDTASNAASLLLDIGTGGGSYASVFSVGKTGNIKLGPNATGTDQNGTSVTISGSLGTGTGASGNLVRQTGFSAKSTGSGANTLVARDVIVAKGKVLTDATATSLFEVALPTLTMCGGTITATTICTDGTDMQSITEVVTFSAVNKGGSYTTDIDVGTTSSAISGGTLANTWTVLTGTNKITIQLSSDTSLTPSSNSFLVYYQIKNNSEQAITVV